MSLILISAAMTAALDAGAGVPSEIVYLPEGEHDITPTVNGNSTFFPHQGWPLQWAQP